MDEFTKEAMKMMAIPIAIGLGILGFELPALWA